MHQQTTRSDTHLVNAADQGASGLDAKEVEVSVHQHDVNGEARHLHRQLLLSNASRVASIVDAVTGGNESGVGMRQTNGTNVLSGVLASRVKKGGGGYIIVDARRWAV